MRKRCCVLVVIGFIAVVLVGCGRGEGFTGVDGVFPPSHEGVSNSNHPVRVNLYIQATTDMLSLFEDASIYADMVRVLQGTAENLWGFHGVSLHTFRFDIEWIENRVEAGYIRTAQHFAYPLDPYWWYRPGDVAPQIPQIFNADFYQLEWYFSQYLRAPDIYRNRIVYNSPALTHHGHARLSRTFEEIAHLRGGQREISVVVTNFVGHSVEGIPLEDESVREQILKYLQENPHAAIGTFTFPNNDNPFHFIVLGSSMEVSAFSQHLMERLPMATFHFDFYTHAPIASVVSTNAASSPGVPSVDVVQVSIPTGVVQVFDVDLVDGEEDAFRRHFGGTHMFYHITPNQVDGSIAHLTFDVRLHIPYRISRIANFEYELSFLELRRGGLETIGIGDSRFVINSKAPHPEGGTHINVSVYLDVTIVPRSRTMLTLRLYENIYRTPILGNSTTALFQETFRQLAQDVNLAAQHRRQSLSRNVAAELHLYFVRG